MISEKHAEDGGFIDKQNKGKIHFSECQRKITKGKTYWWYSLVENLLGQAL